MPPFRRVLPRLLPLPLLVGAVALGCSLPGGDVSERAFWQELAGVFQECLLTGTEASCRAQVEADEWTPINASTVPGQELTGTIAAGGTTYASPTRAPEGDFCASHDDIDWNFNVSPDPAYLALLQPENYVQDEDHPAGGVIEAEWEGFFLDPTYVAKPAGAGADYQSWGKPSVDMVPGDRVALRGPGVLDKGHSPYRAEIHPYYLLLWGGLRGGSLQVYARASALLTRPAEWESLPSPPLPSEAVTARFALPGAPNCPTGAPALQVTPRVDWLYDSPSIVVDQSCDLANGVSLTDLTGPSFDAALCSPAAHLAGTNTTSGAASFFSLAASTSAGDLVVTLTPLARPRQALYGAAVNAVWSCP